MGTQITKIKGTYELVQEHRKLAMTPEYSESILYINRYWGGTKKGAMIQLTIQEEYTAYTQLTRAQIKELITILQNVFDYDKYPSE